MRGSKPNLRKEVSMNPQDVGLVGRRLLMDIIPLPSTYARPPLAATRLGKRMRVVDNNQIPRFQYAPFRGLDVDRILGKTSESTESFMAEVRVPAAQLTPRNEGLKKRLLWGCGEYTDDSDVVAMLVHQGRIGMHAKGAAPFDALIVTLSLKRHKRGSSPQFLSREGHGLRSRSWSSLYDGARVSVVRVMALRDGLEKELPTPLPAVPPNAIPKLRSWHPIIGDNTRGDTVFSSESACFNLSNRPCLSFSIAVVADKGNDKSLWPSRRLWREALYVETIDKRYEIAKVDAPDKEPAKDEAKLKEGGKEKEVVKEKRKGLFIRFGQVSPKVVKREFFSTDISPVMGPADVADLEDGFGVYKWSAVRWDPAGLTLNGVHYDLKRVFFRPIISKKKDVEKTDNK